MANNQAIQALITAMARAQNTMPSTSSTFDMSRAFMDNMASPDQSSDVPHEVSIKNGLNWLGKQIAPDTTQAIMQGKGIFGIGGSGAGKGGAGTPPASPTPAGTSPVSPSVPSDNPD